MACHLTSAFPVRYRPDCRGSNGVPRGWILGTWTGGDLLSRKTVPAYRICETCNGDRVVRNGGASL